MLDVRAEKRGGTMVWSDCLRQQKFTVALANALSGLEPYLSRYN